VPTEGPGSTSRPHCTRGHRALLGRSISALYLRNSNNSKPDAGSNSRTLESHVGRDSNYDLEERPTPVVQKSPPTSHTHFRVIAEPARPGVIVGAIFHTGIRSYPASGIRLRHTGISISIPSLKPGVESLVHDRLTPTTLSRPRARALSEPVSQSKHSWGHSNSPSPQEGRPPSAE
jgi:hypothetical protein